MDEESEEKGSATFVAADHDNSLSEPFQPRIAKIVTPGIKIGKKLGLLNFETLAVQSNLHKIIG